MRKVVWISAFVFAAATGIALAGPKQSAKVDIPDKATFAGKTLPAGQYTISWHGDPSDIDVTFRKGHRVVAEGHGRLETSTIKYRDDAVVTRQNTSGAPALTEIELGGRNAALILQHS